MDALTGPNRKSAPIKSQFVQFNEALTHCAFFQYQIYIVFHARENSLQRIPGSAESTSAYVFICPRHCNCVSCLLVNIATLPHNTIHHKRVFFVLVCWCLLLLCPLIRPLRRKNLAAGKHTFVHTYDDEWGGDDDDDDDADAVPSIVVSLLCSYLYAQLMESPQCLRFGSCDTYCMLNSPKISSTTKRTEIGPIDQPSKGGGLAPIYTSLAGRRNGSSRSAYARQIMCNICSGGSLMTSSVSIIAQIIVKM